MVLDSGGNQNFPPLGQTHATALREDLSNWFKDNAPSLGELYAGAQDLLYGRQVPGWTRFVAHAIREITTCLPRVIAGLKSQQVQYKNQMDAIVKGPWRVAGYPTDGSIPPNKSVDGGTSEPEPDMIVSRELFSAMAQLVKDHVEGRNRPPDAAAKLFDSLVPGDQNSAEARDLFVAKWLISSGWFMSRAHDSGRPDSSFNRADYVTQFEIFEELLAAPLRPFFRTADSLDAIIQDANS